MLKKYKNQILLNMPFIDDGLGITNPNAEKPFDTEDLKKDLNDYGALKWTIMELFHKINFLDMILKICQKWEN